jgi:hypothetical protein
MNKALLLTLLLAALPLLGAAQPEALARINEQRLRTSQASMYILGGWAAGNMAVSGYLRGRRSGEARYFHEMNVFWNVVNLGLAAGGLYSVAQAQGDSLSLWQTVEEQQKLEKILLFNLALNFTYITAGALLRERAQRPGISRPERLSGYGRSLILQGGFLLLFDTGQYIAQRSQSRPALREVLEHVSYSENGLGLQWRF